MSSKIHLNISVQAEVVTGRERESRTKSFWGEALDMKAVSLLVPIRSVPAKSQQLEDLHQLKSWSRLFPVQAGTGTADACNMLLKKPSIFISLQVHFILILFHGKSEQYKVFMPCFIWDNPNPQLPTIKPPLYTPSASSSLRHLSPCFLTLRKSHRGWILSSMKAHGC